MLVLLQLESFVRDVFDVFHERALLMGLLQVLWFVFLDRGCFFFKYPRHLEETESDVSIFNGLFLQYGVLKFCDNTSEDWSKIS